MSISYDTELASGLRKAEAKAKALGRTVLFSEVKKVDYIDPLSFYRAGREKYEGERFFWQDPEKDLIIAGLGRAVKLQEECGANRFTSMESVWAGIKGEAVIQGPAGVDATGPIMFGGFSFDYKKSSSRLWEQFGDHLFYIPSLMLSIVKGQAYITTVYPCGENSGLISTLYKELDTVLEESGRNAGAVQPEISGQTEVSPEAWKESVRQAVEEINSPENVLDKMVLAREMRVSFSVRVQSESVLENLQAEQKGSYIFSFESGSDCFIGATPERLVKNKDGRLFSACLAGSIARGTTKAEDEALGRELLADEKNRMEHQYVVSMITDALGAVCTRLDVPEEPVLMKNRHIQHLYTPVSGIADGEVSILNVVERLHPTPAMGGLPKELAVSRIREIEELERGFYAGPIGWMDAYGNGEFAVGIRSALLQGREASLFAGCGVVGESDPESEYKETGIKFNPMLSALGGTLHE